MSGLLVELSYLAATALFIFSLYFMSDPKTARHGVGAGALGMGLAILGTSLQPGIVNWGTLLAAAVLGAAVGVPLANVPLTAVPQRTALSHAFGGLAAGLVGAAKYYLWLGEGGQGLTPFRMTALVFEIILGCLTFTGSLMAAGKLQELSFIPQRPVTYRFQNLSNLSLLGVAVVCGLLLVWQPVALSFLLPVIVVLALAFGVLLIIPIGGADMPTVISLLNSYAGLAAVAMGFVLDNKLLVIAGALDGSSGLILSIVMCRAMNRSFTNVLFGAFGQVQARAQGEARAVKSETAEGAAQLLEQARLVVVVPGYGMAVAQAQHRLRELYEQLHRRGVDVRFAIHPVAGRMPGHMNVLLAEANIPYDRLAEMDDVNPDLPQCDVCLVVGANDVVNPAARHDKSSPIYGMPIIDADKAHLCLAIKRGMSAGFAGVDNELYTGERTYMLFGDAKVVVGDIVKHLSGQAGGH